MWFARRNFPKRNIFEKKKQKMLIICHIDWREVGVAFELQCLRNCTLSSCIYIALLAALVGGTGNMQIMRISVQNTTLFI